MRSSPGSPSKAKPGARRFDEDKAIFPRPPKPPWAAIKVVPVPTRSAICSPAASKITVPFGTPRIKSSPWCPSLRSP